MEKDNIQRENSSITKHKDKNNRNIDVHEKFTYVDWKKIAKTK